MDDADAVAGFRHTYIDDVKQATDDSIGRIKKLMEKHTQRSVARPTVMGEVQDSSCVLSHSVR